MKTCRTCVHALTRRESCEGCLTPKNEDGSFAYRNYVEGDPVARLIEMQRSGERNIVLGGEGEHEVNVSWSIDEAYKKLSHVCEECGGLCWKEKPNMLIVDKTYGGAFTMEYEEGKLARIYKETRQISKRLWWIAEK